MWKSVEKLAVHCTVPGGNCSLIVSLYDNTPCTTTQTEGKQVVELILTKIRLTSEGDVEDMCHILLTCTQYVAERQILPDTVRGCGRPSVSLHDFIFSRGPPGIVRFVFRAIAVFLAKFSVGTRLTRILSLIIH